MSRYIEADDVANAIYHHFPSIRTMADARGIIEEAPSIDIVRCKECKHWRNTDAEKIPTASIACGNMHPDDFCSYGERKESE